MVELGWKAGPEQYGPNELLEYAIAAEQAGFDSLEASDHFNPWSEAGQACFVWTWLGAAAAKTSKIGLGTGVTCPIIRYDPAVIAQAAATLAVMAPNRSFLCVGTGEALNEYAATGLWPGYDERQAMLGEAIQLIRQLWSGEDVSFDGEYFETRKARLFTRPDKAPPLYVSSLVPDSATFAGTYGDGLISVGGKEPDIYKKMMQNFVQGARKAGKDPATMPRLIEVNVAYTDDKQAAIECQKKYWAGTYIPALFDQKIYTPKMSAENGKAVGSDTIEKMVCISANPDDHVRFAQQYIDLGFTHVYFHSAGPDQKAFLEGYGKDVLPKIRQNNAGRGAQTGQVVKETVPVS
ncbi:MAG TPA: TIGR03557 family F420-dependent LLM class oxidoreductase [Chloroflexota bacterium]|nr:TIGR03557 family F420-dependent LLM class oxidoreductase [Chloroflexota bacterium]